MFIWVWWWFWWNCHTSWRLWARGWVWIRSCWFCQQPSLPLPGIRGKVLRRWPCSWASPSEVYWFQGCRYWDWQTVWRWSWSHSGTANSIYPQSSSNTCCWRSTQRSPVAHKVQCSALPSLFYSPRWPWNTCIRLCYRCSYYSLRDHWGICLSRHRWWWVRFRETSSKNRLDPCICPAGGWWWLGAAIRGNWSNTWVL